MREKRGMGGQEKGGENELGKAEGAEGIIRILYVRKIYFKLWEILLCNL